MPTSGGVATGTLPTSGTVDLTISGFGDVDAALIVAGNANTTNNPADDLFLSFGLWDGVNGSAVSDSVYSQDAVGLGVRKKRRSIGEFADDRGNFSYTCAAITDGIRLTAAGSPGVARYVFAIFLGGLTNVKIVNTSLAADTSPNDITSVGFEPNLIFVLDNGKQNSDSTSDHSSMSFGFWHKDGAGTQREHAIRCGGVHNQFTSVTANRISASYCALSSGSVNPGYFLNISDPDSSGFTVTNSAYANYAYPYFLAIELANPDDFWAGLIDAATSTGDDSTTGAGFTPDVVGLLSGMATAVDTNTNGNALMFGAADSSRQRCISGFDQHNVSTMNCGVQSDSSNILRLFDHSGTDDAIASLSSLDSDGFTINYSDAAASAKKILAFAIGDSTAGGGGPSVNINGSTVSWNGLTSYNWNGIA